MSRSRANRISTPALSILEDRGVSYSIHTFEHDADHTDFGEEAARNLGCDPAAVLKTLIWNVDENLCLALAPVPQQISSKLLATALNGRRATLTDPAVAQRVSGSVVGGISPIGLRKTLPAVADESILKHAEVYVSGGKRGLEICLAPQDLITLTQATLAPISRPPREPR